jgi:predicted signal transduction protein with EAL and GGDEF domain
VINNLDDGIIVIDHKNRIIALNPSARLKFNLSENFIGQSVSEIKNDLTIKIEELLRAQQTQVDIEINGTPTRYYDLRIAPVLNTRGLNIGHVVTTRDISERVDLFNQVQQLSIKDSLTNIYNRRHFIELCNHEINRFKRYPGKPLALVMIDLDHFKDINDTYGTRAR